MGLLQPTWMVRGVTEIAPEWLVARGIKAILCDVDNTIVPWHSEVVPAQIDAWLAGLRAQGFGICLVSNTRRPERLARLAKRLEIRHVPGNAGKPGVRGLQTGLKILGAEPWEAALIGDQLFTDVVGGNKLSLTTILVNPLTTHEFIGTWLISRNLERLVLRGDRRRPQ
jgi:HAD superfamily phosphatase (TIGR01668 family)